MQPGKPNGRRRLWFHFLLGSFYLTWVAAVFAGITGSNFLVMSLAVFLGAILLGILALAWMTGWAVRDDSRLGQFGVASLLLVTLFVAIFFSVVRWLAVNLDMPGIENSDDNFGFLAIGCLLLLVCGVRLWIGFMESLVWAAVWIVRRPFVRRWLAQRRNEAVSRPNRER